MVSIFTNSHKATSCISISFPKNLSLSFPFRLVYPCACRSLLLLHSFVAFVCVFCCNFTFFGWVHRNWHVFHAADAWQGTESKLSLLSAGRKDVCSFECKYISCFVIMLTIHYSIKLQQYVAFWKFCGISVGVIFWENVFFFELATLGGKSHN